MTERERAILLLKQTLEYPTKDPRWRRQYHKRFHRLAGKFDASSPETDAVIVLALDVAGHRIGIRPKWGNEQ